MCFKTIIKLLLPGLIFKLFFVFQGAAQQHETISSYIDKYKDVSINHMKKYGIPASIKLGQGILESGFGNSDLAVEANNHFGIKCHGWQYATFYKDDDKKNECFRSYKDPISSFNDHSEFLSTRQRYSFLFDLNPLDYKGWAKGLREAGYATNPNYPQLLINIIEKHELYKYDQKIADSDKMPSLSKKNHEDRKVKLNNRVKYIYARQGETPASIAEEMDIWTWEVKRYNELESDNIVFDERDIVYLQRKRRRGETNHHIIQEGETMYDISQLYGIRLKHLYRRNNIEPGSIPKPGQKILLRGRVRD